MTLPVPGSLSLNGAEYFMDSGAFHDANNTEQCIELQGQHRETPGNLTHEAKDFG